MEDEDVYVDEILSRALQYARQGWRVLPIWWVDNGICGCGEDCKSPGKHPIGHMVPDGLKSASRDGGTIRAWHTAAPKMNLAVATGSSSNLIVFDLDLRIVEGEEVDGEYELAAWLAGRGLPYPETLVQRTGGGGSHILLDWQPPAGGLRPVVPSRVNWLPAVDIRADGGYIVVAPSQHVSGRFYQWSPDGNTLSAISEELLNVLATERRQSSPTGRTMGTGDYSVDVRDAVDHGFQAGGRDDGFVRLVGVLRARGESLEDARVIVQSVWEKTAQPEGDFYPLSNAMEKLSRGYRTWDAPEPLSDVELSWAAKVTSRIHDTKPERSELVEADSDDDDPADVEGDRDPILPLDVSGLMAGGEIEREEPSMLTRTDGKSLIYPGRLHSIYGEPGHGKTWVSLYLVRERIEQGETVVYLDYDEDDGGRTMATRLLSLGVPPEIVSSNLRYLNPQGMGTDLAAWRRLRKSIRRWKPSVVVVDTMAPALVELGLSEKDNTEVGTWYRHIRWLLSGLDPQAALVIIDHVTKSGEGRGRWARGAGDKLGRLHAAYAVESTVPFSRTMAGQIRLTVAKDRGGEVGREGDTAAVVKFNPTHEGKQLTITLEVPGSASLSELAAANANRVEQTRRKVAEVISNGESLTAAEIRRKSGGDRDHVDDILASMVGLGQLVVDDLGRAPRYRLV